MYFPLGFQFFICSSPVTAESNLRGRIMMHIAVKTFIHNTDFPVIFPSRWTLGQLLSLCIPWQRSDVSSSALHFQTWKYTLSHMELILKFHVCSRPFDDESSLWSIAQNVLDMVSPRWRVGVSYFAYISRKSFPPIEINWKNWLPASSGWYGFCVADSRGRDQFPSIKSWDVENIHPPQIQGKYVFLIHVGDKKYQKSKWIQAG